MLRMLSLLVIFAGTSLAQVDALRAEIRAAYVVDLSQPPGTDLLHARDFFDFVKTKLNRGAYAEALRAEMEDRRNSARMRVDGSVRLLGLSDAPSDFLLAARVLARADFRQVAIASYYAAAKRLAGVNVDISPVAFRLLEQPDVKLLWGGVFSLIKRRW